MWRTRKVAKLQGHVTEKKVTWSVLGPENTGKVQTSADSLLTNIREHRLWWWGHVQRMDDGTWKTSKTGTQHWIREGSRKIGRPRITWNDNIWKDIERTVELRGKRHFSRWPTAKNGHRWSCPMSVPHIGQSKQVGLRDGLRSFRVTE